MCGRFVTSDEAAEERYWSTIRPWYGRVAIGYNVAPTQVIPAETKDGKLPMRWGLVPHWAKAVKSKFTNSNARLETVSKVAAFRGPWKHSKTCIIPAAGYYEWQSEDDVKQPYYIHREDGERLLFAGLWETWQGEEGELLSCTIITKDSERHLEALHHRMPCLLTPDQADDWLNANAPDDHSVLLETDLGAVTYHAVSTRVNNSRNEGKDLIERIH